MKKGVIATLVAAAVIGGGAYYALQHKGASQASSLSYVPADTLVFAGGLEPMSWSQLAAFRDSFAFSGSPESTRKVIEELLKSEAEGKSQTPPGMQLLISLYADYLAAVTAKDFSPAVLGLGEQIDSAFYTVGALPVLRLKLQDEAAFDTFLAKAASRFKLQPQTGTVDGFNYQRYALNQDEKQPVFLAIGKRDGFLVITLDLGTLAAGKQEMALAFGLSKPTQSLASSGVLEGMMKENGLLPFSLGYLNHEGLVKTLTRADSPLAILLDKVSEGKSAASLAAYRTPACQSEIEGMVALWPRSVFGYTEFDGSGSPIRANSLFKMVSTDKATMDQLQKLRGFLPDFSAAPSQFSYQLGFNMDELTPVVTSLWSRATQAKFSCEPLVEVQARLRELNPGLLGAMTGMMQGVQGASINLQELSLKPAVSGSDMPVIEKLSFIATFSGKQPQQMWSMLAMTQPQLAATPLPADGQSIELPLPLPVTLPGKVKLGVFGNHIALFTGDKAEALTTSLGKQELKANGFVHMGIDYTLVADALGLALQQKEAELKQQLADAAAAPADEQPAATEEGMIPEPTPAERKAQVEKELAEIKSTGEMMNHLRGMRIDSDVDFTATGIDMKANMALPKH